jgi:hypothetical protein
LAAECRIVRKRHIFVNVHQNKQQWTKIDKTTKHKHQQQQQQQQVLHHLYQGTSTTTSEEEDENVYDASRGASVCSSLLHAMVQIDEHIPDAPYHTFEASTVPPSANMNINGHKRKAASSIVIHRGSFTCTATIKLVNKESNEETGNHLEDEKNNTQEEEKMVETLQVWESSYFSNRLTKDTDWLYNDSIG